MLRCHNGLLAFFLLFGYFQIALADADPMSYDAIQQRLQPIGEVRTAASSDNTLQLTMSKHENTSRSGQTTYEETCRVCHDTGAVGAPRFGDRHAWQTRLAQGLSVLTQHALQGYRFMPPRGNCFDCSDTDIQRAVIYMTQKAKS